MANAATATAVRFKLAPAKVQPLPSPWSLRGMPTAPYQAVHGRPHAWTATLTATLLRSALIGGGLYVAGVREPMQLVGGSLAASATLTALRIATHATKHSRTA
jgi:hypothetical protein